MVNNGETKVIYKGDGKTKTFPYTFTAVDADTIKVAVYDETSGVESTLTNDYYVDTTAKTVTYPGYAPGQEPAESQQPGVLQETQKLVIYRETPLDQQQDLGEKYPLPIVESIADKLTLIVQELKETLERTITIDISSNETTEQLKERIFTAEETASEMAKNASTSAENAAASEKAAKSSEENAGASEKNAAEILENIEAAATTVGGIATVYSSIKTYRPTDQVMLPDGTTYRCIAQSTGEYPPMSGKWVQTSMSTQDTFERDFNDDLMPTEHAKATRLWAIDAEEDIFPAENAG